MKRNTALKAHGDTFIGRSAFFDFNRVLIEGLNLPNFANFYIAAN